MDRVPLHGYQIEDVESLLRRESPNGIRAYLASDVGVGKSAVVIELMRRRGFERSYGLIIVPKAAIRKWKDEEFDKFAPELKENVICLDDSVGTLEERNDIFRQNQNRGTIFITNLETIRDGPMYYRKSRYGYWRVDEGPILERLPEYYVGDEFHTLRDPKTRSASMYWSPAEVAEERGVLMHRLCLSATPIDAKPSDLFFALKFLYPLEMTSFWAFVGDWEVRRPGRYSDYEFKGLREERFPEEWSEFLLDVGLLRRDKEDVLDLPRLSIRPIVVPMTEPQSEMWQSISKYQFYDTSNGRIWLDSIGAVWNAMCQVAVSPQVVGGPDKSSMKFAYIADALRKSNTSIVVFSRFLGVVNALEEGLRESGYEVVRITGEENVSKREHAYVRVNRREVDCCLCTYGASALAINLTGAHHAIMTDLPLSYSDWYQSIGRLHRQGQTRNVRIDVLMTEGSLDRKQFNRIRQKKDMTRKVIENIVRGANFCDL